MVFFQNQAVLFFVFSLVGVGATPSVFAQKMALPQQIMLVPLQDEQSSKADPLHSFHEKLYERLSRDFSVLPPKVSAQILSGSISYPTHQKTAGLITQTDAVLDRYYSYQKGAKESLSDLTGLLQTMRATQEVSQGLSSLIVSTTLTKAWLEYQTADTESSQKTLATLQRLSPKQGTDLRFFPPAFQRFAKKTAEQVSSGSSSLQVHSSPEAADVYVDNVLVGVTPFEAKLNAGKYRVTVHAPGRASVTKDISLKTEGTEKISLHLPWQGRSRQKDVLQSWQKWQTTSLEKKIALASQLAATSNSDIVGFLTVTQAEAKVVPKIQLYNDNFSQLIKEFTYPEKIENFSEAENDLTRFFSKKMRPYLKDRTMTYWTKNIDRDVITDYRVASRLKKPLYKRPLFWVSMVGLAATGIGLGLAVAGSGAATGGIILTFGGL